MGGGGAKGFGTGGVFLGTGGGDFLGVTVATACLGMGGAFLGGVGANEKTLAVSSCMRWPAGSITEASARTLAAPSDSSESGEGLARMSPRQTFPRLQLVI